MSVQRNVLANLVAGGWLGLLGLAMLPVYMHYLGVEAYGLIGFFATLQAWFLMLDLGLSPTLNREMARYSAGRLSAQYIADLVRSMELVYGGVALLLATAMLLSATWFAENWLNTRALQARSVALALALMGPVFALQWMATIYRSALLGLQHQLWLSATSSLLATARALATVLVLAAVSSTVVAFVLVQCAASLAEVLVLAHRARGLLPVPPQPARFRLSALRGIWRFAAGLALVTVLSTLLSQVDKLLLAKLLTLEDFGYFTLAVAAAGVLSLAVGPVHNAAYPRLSELAASSDERALAAEYHRLAQILAAAVLPLAALLTLFPSELLLLWTRNPEIARSVAPIMSIWAAGTALNGLMHLPYAAQLAHGWSRPTIAVNLVAVVLIVPATLFLVPRFGAVAAAWIWVAINLGYASVYVGVMHGRILRGEKWRWYLQDALCPLVAAALPVASARAVHDRLPPLQPAAELAFLAVALAVSVLGALAATPTGRALLCSLASLARPHSLQGPR